MQSFVRRSAYQPGPYIRGLVFASFAALFPASTAFEVILANRALKTFQTLAICFVLLQDEKVNVRLAAS